VVARGHRGGLRLRGGDACSRNVSLCLRELRARLVVRAAKPGSFGPVGLERRSIRLPPKFEPVPRRRECPCARLTRACVWFSRASEACSAAVPRYE
jgi:hypothetical protein